MATNDEIKITIARLEAMPSHLKLSIGNHGSFGKNDLINHVKKGDEIGNLMTRMTMVNLRAFKKQV